MKNVKIFKRKFSIKKLLLALLMLVTITSCNSNERKAKKLIKNYCLEKDNIEVYDIKMNKMEPVYINDYTEEPEYKDIEENYNSLENSIEFYYNTLTKWRSTRSDEEIERAYEMYYKCVEARDGLVNKANMIKESFEPYQLGYSVKGRFTAKRWNGEGYWRFEALFNPEMTKVISLNVE